MADRTTTVGGCAAGHHHRSSRFQFLLMMVVVISACATGARSRPELDQMLANAKTGADHETIAEYYQQEAHEARAKYEQHKASAAEYRRALRWGGWAEHCDRLAQDYKRAAEDASWLAAHHRKIADEAGSAERSRPTAGSSNETQDR